MWAGDAVLVAEVTQPSLGVGYEIGRAIEMNKNILCLFRPSDTEKSEPIIFIFFIFVCVYCIRTLSHDKRSRKWEECHCQGLQAGGH